MRQNRGSEPPGVQLAFCIGRVLRDQLDGGTVRLSIVVVRQKDSAIRRTAQIAAQVEFSVDRLPYPLLPGLGHRHLCELVLVLLAHTRQVPRRKFRRRSLPARRNGCSWDELVRSALPRHGALPAAGEGTGATFFNCSSWA